MTRQDICTFEWSSLGTNDCSFVQPLHSIALRQLVLRLICSFVYLSCKQQSMCAKLEAHGNTTAQGWLTSQILQRSSRQQTFVEMRVHVFCQGTVSRPSATGHDFNPDACHATQPQVARLQCKTAKLGKQCAWVIYAVVLRAVRNASMLNTM